MEGMNKPYPPTATNKALLEKNSRLNKVRQLQGKGISTPSEEAEQNHCSDNLLAAWPLISWLASRSDKDSATILQNSFSMCEPLTEKNGDPLLKWAKAVWFDLAEGSFPYPSSYIPFALLHKKINLPPWPTQYACWKSSNLHRDWGVRFDGSKEDVRYTIDYGNSGIRLKVDWDRVEQVDMNDQRLSKAIAIEDSSDVIGLLTSVRDAVSIWYNITKDVPCYNISKAAPNSDKITSLRRKTDLPFLSSTRESYNSFTNTGTLDAVFNPAEKCHEAMIKQGSWGMLCCNDEMNLVITNARGMGKDFFWPPSHPKSVRTYQDMISNATFEPCSDPYEIYGYSKEPYEPLSKRLDTYYGGIRMSGHSNIVFSNGLLDPWSAGGVYKDNINPTILQESSPFWEDKLTVQNITDNDIVALIIPYGGHHTDLMYSSSSDPSCVTESRLLEEAFIERWILDW